MRLTHRYVFLAVAGTAVLIMAAMSYCYVVHNPRPHSKSTRELQYDAINRGNKIVAAIHKYRKEEGKWPYRLADLSKAQSTNIREAGGIITGDTCGFGNGEMWLYFQAGRVTDGGFTLTCYYQPPDTDFRGPFVMYDGEGGWILPEGKEEEFGAKR